MSSHESTYYSESGGRRFPRSLQHSAGETEPAIAYEHAPDPYYEEGQPRSYEDEFDALSDPWSELLGDAQADMLFDVMVDPMEAPDPAFPSQRHLASCLSTIG